MAQKNATSDRQAGKTHTAEKPRAAEDPNRPPPGNHADDFEPKIDLPGKTDSGPEPDVFGREIPPQK
jgi:hypothetical protein